MFFKIGVLKNFAIFTGKHLWWIYLKENPTQVFYWKYSKTLKSTYFEEHLGTAASLLIIIKLVIKYWVIKNITWYGFY